MNQMYRQPELILSISKYKYQLLYQLLLQLMLLAWTDGRSVYGGSLASDEILIVLD